MAGVHKMPNEEKLTLFEVIVNLTTKVIKSSKLVN